jgi:DNA polymerase
MKEWTTLLESLTTYLLWEQERGVRVAEVDPATMRELSAAGKAGPVRPPVPAAAVASTGASVFVAAVAPPPVGMPVVPPGGAAVPAARVPPIAFTPPVTGDMTPALPVETPENRQAALDLLVTKIASCRQCPLCEQRTQTVPGQGKTLSPDILFLGDAPAAEDDREGAAFRGASGELLTRMIEAMGYTRDEVFLTTLCKCHPPANRQVTAAEMQSCLPYLRAQLAAIRPRTLVALGASVVTGLLMESSSNISRLRGVWTTFQGIPLMPTFHPARLLRYPDSKKDAWLDLQKVLKHLGRPIPPPKKKSA